MKGESKALPPAPPAPPDDGLWGYIETLRETKSVEITSIPPSTGERAVIYTLSIRETYPWPIVSWRYHDTTEASNRRLEVYPMEGRGWWGPEGWNGNPVHAAIPIINAILSGRRVYRMTCGLFIHTNNDTP